MDWTTQTQEMFKNWTEVQKKTWENWLDAMQSFDKSQPGQIWQKTIDAWQESVKKSLDLQVEGSRIWAESLSSVKGAPKETTEWAQQMQDMTKRWTEVQQQLWDNWFEMMKKVDPSKFAGNWDKEGQNLLQTWQEMTQKAVDTQTEWMHKWATASKKEG